MFSVLLFNTFTVQILYSLQLNCTYSNYTEAAATCSAAQHYSNCPADILMCSATGSFKYVRIHSAMSLDRTFQIHASAPKHNITFSQYYETHPTVCLRYLQAFCLLCTVTFRSVARYDVTCTHKLIPCVTIYVQQGLLPAIYEQ